VAKWGVANVVSQTSRLNYIRIEAAPNCRIFGRRAREQALGNPSPDLGDLQRMGKAVVEEVNILDPVYLGNRAKTPER
jgi:hypothetical protein